MARYLDEDEIRERLLQRDELQERILDRYDLHELIELLGLTVEDICDKFKELIIEQEDFLDVW